MLHHVIDHIKSLLGLDRERLPFCVAVYSDTLREWIPLCGKIPEHIQLPQDKDIVTFTEDR